MTTRELSAAEAGGQWVNGRFSMRSGFYAGRPPSESDLNSRILEMFYQGIKRDVGEDEAANIVRFVNNLKDLSASAFIVAFERFWANGCREVNIEQSSSDGMRLDGRGEKLEAEAYGLIATVLGSRSLSTDQLESISMRIKQLFIQQHMHDIPENERHSNRLSPRRMH